MSVKEIDTKEAFAIDRNQPGSVKALLRINILVDKINEIVRELNKKK